MKFPTLIRALLAISLPAMLSACGGSAEPETEGLAQTVAMNEASNVSAVQVATAPPQAVVTRQPVVYAADGPVPDCAPENCSALRIIDANAEEYRLQVMERKQSEEAQAGV